MGLVDVPTLLRIADRAAYQYGQLKSTLAAISVQGTAYYWETVTDTENTDFEIPTLGSYKTVDDDFAATFAARYGTQLPLVVWAMDAHFNWRGPSGAPLQVGSWDGYLQANNQRVSQYFGELYYATKGFYMAAVDVFSESTDQFARAQVAAGPVVVFTDGVNYGTGSAQLPANGVYFAATQLKVYVAAMGATQLDLRLSVKDLNNNPTTIDVTIPGGSIVGTVVNVGTSANRFLDVTGVAYVPAGAQGTVGDDMRVQNLKERTIAL